MTGFTGMDENNTQDMHGFCKPACGETGNRQSAGQTGLFPEGFSSSKEAEDFLRKLNSGN